MNLQSLSQVTDIAKPFDVSFFDFFFYPICSSFLSSHKHGGDGKRCKFDDFLVTSWIFCCSAVFMYLFNYSQKAFRAWKFWVVTKKRRMRKDLRKQWKMATRGVRG